MKNIAILGIISVFVSLIMKIFKKGKPTDETLKKATRLSLNTKLAQLRRYIKK